MTDATFWRGRWERGETGWHQSEVETLLKKHFPSKQDAAVFVPLCGKSLDLAWLASEGYAVIGVELSPIACRAFFEENRIAYKVERLGRFERYTGGPVTIWCGDFFDLEPAHLAGVTRWYDRAATIALPPELRARYAERLQSLLLACAGKAMPEGLLVTLEYPQEKHAGPPFSVPEAEVRALYEARFRVSRVSREDVPFGEGSPLHGIPVHENAFVLASR